MGIVGTDDRTIINTPSGTNGNVVAVDIPNTNGTDPGYNAFNNLAGSGFAIGSDFFLTAGHVVNGNGAGRITMAPAVSALAARGLQGAQFVPPNNQLNISAVTNFNVDMSLLQTTGDLTTDASVIGMAVFYDHRDLNGLTMVTAGYPIQNTSNVPTPDATGRTMTQSSSLITATSDTQFSYTADTQGGQSGSGVWLDSSTYSIGSNLANTGLGDLLVGVHFQGSTVDNDANRISPEIYKTITDTMSAAAGGQVATEATNLPVNVLMGGGIDGVGPVQSFVPEDNYIDGSYRREHIFGRSGEDRIEGGGGNDTIDGGFGVDQALFSGAISDYTITILDATDPDNPTVQIAHTGGAMSEGTDRISNTEYAVFEYLDADAFTASGYGADDDQTVMFVPLLADEDDPTKLRDGTLLNISQDVVDTQGDAIGSMSVEIPAFMFDGDVDYTFSLGADSNILYNFAYIVDSSGSMSGTNIAETRAAYEALTNDLISQGVADRSQFAVVDFDSFATLFSGLDAQGAIDTVNGLIASGGTSFGPALSTAESWFESLPNVGTATNIAYFLSDGQGSGASDALQLVAEGTANEAQVDVRAFGIGFGANLNSLNIIDSGSAVLLLNPSDLTDAFAVSGVDKDTIDRVEVKLDGAVVETILPAQLVDGALGLTYEGSISGLEVTITAENIVTFDVVFNDGTPTATIQSKITTGQTELRTASNDGTTEFVALSVDASNYVIQGQSEIVSANDLNNTITIDSGSHVLKGFGGDDAFVMNGGVAAIDGGDGVDTVIYNQTRAGAGDLTKNGSIVTVGTGDTLVDVEFVEFSDQRVQLSTLSVAPILAVSSDTVQISETDANGMTADFTLTLSSAAATDVVVNVSTRDGSATAGLDYVALSDTITFLAGETQKTVSVGILDDAVVEGDEAFFVDLALSGDATFADSTVSAVLGVGVADDDALFKATFVGDALSFAEGTFGANMAPITIRRDGDISGAAQINYVVSGITADAADFGGAFPSGSVAFAAGQSEATITIPITTDAVIEADETFLLDLSLSSGNGSLSQNQFTLSIIDDDLSPISAPLPPRVKSDFNTDSIDDVFLFNRANGNTGIWEMSPTGPVWSGVAGLNLPSGGVGVGDLNGNGASEILTVNAQQEVVSTEIFLGGQTSTTIAGLGGDWTVAEAGDVNGDGFDDVIIQNSANGRVGVWEMSSTGPTWSFLATTAENWDLAAGGDVTGDGLEDILLANAQNNRVGMWEMTANGPVWSYVTTLQDGWTIAGSGDFNNDSTEDVLLFNSDNGRVGVWEMSGGVPTWSFLATLNEGWSIASTGDFDGNGFDDVLLFNSDNGRVGAWEMSASGPAWDFYATAVDEWSVMMA